jgi:hypothetical protein
VSCTCAGGGPSRRQMRAGVGPVSGKMRAGVSPFSPGADVGADGRFEAQIEVVDREQVRHARQEVEVCKQLVEGGVIVDVSAREHPVGYHTACHSHPHTCEHRRNPTHTATHTHTHTHTRTQTQTHRHTHIHTHIHTHTRALAERWNQVCTQPTHPARHLGCSGGPRCIVADCVATWRTAILSRYSME